MTIKFLIDNLQKEQEETIKKILEVVKKKPYPNRETEHLAIFVHALFQVAPKTKYFRATMTKPEFIPQRTPNLEQKSVQQVREIIKYAKRPLPMPPKPVRAEASNLLPELPIKKFTETPEATTQAQKSEYTVLSFDTPIGILSDTKGENNKPAYTVIEPSVNLELVSMVKELVEKDVNKDYHILDDKDYLKDKCLKAAKKLKAGFSDDMLPSLRYFLKRDLTGFRKLDTFMQDLNVKSIYVDGLNKPVVVETSQYPRGQTNITFNNPEDLNGLIKKIAKATGNEISENKPIIETVFQGFKIQAVLGIGNAASKLIIKKVMA